VELRYDPDDLTVVAVWHTGTRFGDAAPTDISAHVDPNLRAANRPDPGPPTGVAYLDAVAADHAAALRDALTYRDVPLPFPDDSDGPDDGDPDGRDKPLAAGPGDGRAPAPSSQAATR
jgi:hypothetical protein